MKDEKETRQKLQSSARSEFTEKGYMKASLRNICKNAGVTTGALYFFFEDKEDIFASLVQEPLQMVSGLMMEHYRWEKEQVSEEAGGSLFELEDQEEILRDDLILEHAQVFHSVIHELYRYREEFLLLLTKAQGSVFENAVDSFISVAEAQLRLLSDQISSRKKIPRAEDAMIHWVAHLQIEIFVYMLTHVETEEEALKHMNSIIRFLISGWYSMFRKP